MAIKAVVFDAYGTLYDVHSVAAKAEELCPGRGDLITQLWRLKQLEYTWLQTAFGEYRDFAFLTRASLEFALRAAGCEPTPALVEPLLDKYLDLTPYPEAAATLAALRRRGSLKLAILSNGSAGMLAPLAANSGLGAHLDAVLSVDAAARFKPHPACYALVGAALGTAPDEVLFVSSNGFDVAGAKHFGFKVAWIRRGGAPAPPTDPVLPAMMYRLLRGGEETLGYRQDHTLTTLAELDGLL